MKKNPHITSVKVARAIARQERDRADQDLVHRHQSAPRAIGQMEKGEVIRDFVSSRGPRTSTHPMATRIEPEPPHPMATRNPNEAPGAVLGAVLGGAASALLIAGSIIVAARMGSR